MPSTATHPRTASLRTPSAPATALAALALAALLRPADARANHLANHLVITEVGYDTTNETPPNSSEYIEIFNPTNATIVLNDGARPGSYTPGKGSYFISDSPTTYFRVPNGPPAITNGTPDGVWQFPGGTVIPPQGVVVIASDAAMFLSEFFPGGLAQFQSLPGRPQLFQTRTSGGLATVTQMIPAFTGGATTTSNSMNLTNGGEPAILFYWDGASDLVSDVDIVVWGPSGATTEIPTKTAISVDGPDPDTTASTYRADAPTVAQIPPAVATANINSLQRFQIDENQETDTGGNGITGHDETHESWSTPNALASRGASWLFDKDTPGLEHVRNDGVATDALSFLAPVAVSPADGPNGTANPQDFGPDGTLTELYLASIDANNDRLPDSFYVAMRGSLFGEPDTNNTNATFLLIDTNPGGAGGVNVINGPGNELNDTTGTLDTRITNLGFALGANLTGIHWDAAVGMDVSNSGAADTSGWRSWVGTGTTSNFAFLGAATDAQFDGNISAVFPGAPGTSYAAQDGIEASLPYTTLGGGTSPTYIFVAAVTTADVGTNANPNTLPEGPAENFAKPITIDRGVCFEVATGTSYVFFDDADRDGYGGSPSTYCGPPTAAVTTRPGDCDDAKASAHPGATEICNGADDDCNGQTDEGLTIATYYADADNDGFGDPTRPVSACAQPSGYVTNSTDCDDTNAATHPGATETCDNVDNNCDGMVDEGVQNTYYRDADRDTFGDPTNSAQACTAPPGYVANGTDCDDTSATTHPGAMEVCDLADNDCNGMIDEGVQSTFHRDLDRDGFGGPLTTLACVAPPGYVADGTDCDDTDATVNPGATEVCDSIDNNCNGAVDEGVRSTYYADADADGYGDSSRSIQACSAPGGYATRGGDCNDSDPRVNPGATETCNGTDDNCNGQIDEGLAVSTYFRDADSDGFGDSSASRVACSQPAGYAVRGGDCDDADPRVNPGAAETCNGADDNCNGTTDEGVKLTFFRDGDNDGYGDARATTQACSAPAGFVARSGDCDDTRVNVNPTATEVCDGLDNNCDGQTDEGVQITVFPDADRDGYGVGNGSRVCAIQPGFAPGGGDCNDNDPSVHPGQLETCNNVDDNCNGQTDEGVPVVIYWRDADGDGYGDDAQNVNRCSPPAGYVRIAGDCNDANPGIHPGVSETCNSVDDNCNGTTDEGVTSTFYRDADADGVGGTTTAQACSAPSGYVTTTGDCDDANASVHPGASESCNSVDDNCNGMVDEGVTNTFYRDADSDGVGGAASVRACGAPAGYVATTGDCDDTNASVHPGAVETCDSLDNDCNGQTDEGATSAFYRDSDGDSFGAASQSTQACGAPAGYVADNTDCDDANASVHPGASESCNALDDNCNGQTDEGATSAFYRDSDGDSFGAASQSTQACSAPAGYVADNTDCNDANPGVHPGAAEVCDGTDDNCDGATDEGSDGLCAAGQVCAGAVPSCRAGCRDDAGCAGTTATPVCDTATLTCQACLASNVAPCASDTNGRACVTDSAGNFCGCATDSDCGDATSGRVCNPSTRRCVAGCAVSDPDGGAARNGCPTGEFCTANQPGTTGTCTASCNFDSDCVASMPTRPHCLAGTPSLCVECAGDGDCAGRADGRLVCDPSANSCVECTSSNATACDPASVGGACLSGGACGCTTDSDCNTDRQCNTASNRCEARPEPDAGADAATDASTDSDASVIDVIATDVSLGGDDPVLEAGTTDSGVDAGRTDASTTDVAVRDAQGGDVVQTGDAATGDVVVGDATATDARADATGSNDGGTTGDSASGDGGTGGMSGGCGCRTAGNAAQPRGAFALLALGFVALAFARRRKH